MSKKIDLADGKTIAGMDVSSMVKPKQQYDGVVTITGSLVIDQDDLSLTNVLIPDGSGGTTTISTSSTPVP